MNVHERETMDAYLMPVAIAAGLALLIGAAVTAAEPTDERPATQSTRAPTLAEYMKQRLAEPLEAQRAAAERPAIPPPAQISDLTLEPQSTVFPGGEVTEELFRRLLAQAQPLRWTEPWLGHWPYDPWYAGRFTAAAGQYEFILHHGGHLTLTTPAGEPALYAYHIEGELVVYQTEIPDDRYLVVTRQAVDLSALPEINQPLRELPEGRRVMEASGLSVIQVRLRNTAGTSDILLDVYLLPEYPGESRFDVFDARLEGNATVLLVTQEPMNRQTRLRLGSRSIYFDFEASPLRAARMWTDRQRVQMRLVGSLHDNDLGIEILNRHGEKEGEIGRYEYRLSEDWQKLELVHRPDR
jgi:hypothetical protein